MIALDTSFLIDHFRGEEGTRALLEQEDALCICEPVVFEFLCGNLSGREEGLFLRFASQLQTVTFERRGAREAARIFRAGKRKGKPVGSFDALIAGTLLAAGVKRIATRDAAFDSIPGLKAVRY